MTDLRVPPGSEPALAARRLAARPVLRRPGGDRTSVAPESEPGTAVLGTGLGTAGLGTAGPGPGPGETNTGSPSLLRASPDSLPSGGSAGPALRENPAPHPPAPGVWTAGREHTATLARVGVWLLVLSGPVSLLWLATSRPGVAPAPPPPAVLDLGPQAAVAAAAEDAALDWLATGGGTAAAGPDAATVAGPAAGAAVGPAVTVDVTPPAQPAATGPQIWSVLVAVAGATPDATPTYLQVPLLVEAAGDQLPAISPLGQPAVVPGPAPAAADPPSAYRTVLALSDPRAVTAAAFVTALLTGGDVTPLTSPGLTVRAVQPPPAGRVEVRSVLAVDAAGADGVEVAVSGELTSVPATPDDQAAADATEPDATETDATADPTTRTVTYYLSLASRDGRWEIAALRPAPFDDPAPVPADN